MVRINVIVSYKSQHSISKMQTSAKVNVFPILNDYKDFSVALLGKKTLLLPVSTMSKEPHLCVFSSPAQDFCKLYFARAKLCNTDSGRRIGG